MAKRHLLIHIHSSGDRCFGCEFLENQGGERTGVRFHCILFDRKISIPPERLDVCLEADRASGVPPQNVPLLP